MKYKNLFIMILLPILSLYLIQDIRFITPWQWALFILFHFTIGFSITAGYHRYFSHESYQIHPLVKYFYIIFGTSALQGSILEWSFFHKKHHQFCDTHLDPHPLSKGFFWSYLTWTFHNKDKIPTEKKDPILIWQHNYYFLFYIVLGLTLPASIMSIDGSFKVSLGLLLLNATIIHHLTSLTNALSHRWGNQAYNNCSAKNNYLISLISYGEGYHSEHHQNSKKFYFGKLDLTGHFINLLIKMNLAKKTKHSFHLQR